MATTLHLPQPPPPKQHGGKRGPSVPMQIMNSSDEEEPDHCDSISLPNPSPRIRNVSPSVSTYGCDHDHDYENVASPTSSTASGPVYVRPPGFKHHAHEIVAKSKIKKKKTATTFMTFKDGFRRREQTPPKMRPKRDQVPMRLRALPQSFWQQPNVPHQVSPGNLFPILPPLYNKETEEDVTDVRPVTPPEEREEREVAKRPPRYPERKVTVANTDLLFQLFDVVDDKKLMSQQLKRGRPKKVHVLPKNPNNSVGLIGTDDPYLVDAVSQKLFPQLSLENGRNPIYGNTSLQLITVKGDGGKTVTLPSLSTDTNYSQILSELVMHI